MPDPGFVLAPPGGLCRVARLPDARTFPVPAIRPEEEESGSRDGIRRFEDPRGEFGVLYCASSEEAAFGDDIAPYRARKARGRGLVEWIGDFVGIGPDPGEPQPGQVPVNYSDDRVVVQIMVSDRSRFVDLDDPATHAALGGGLADVLAKYRLDGFDRDVIMGPNRAVTGAIARYFYSLGQRPGFGDVVGLRYASRFAPDWERWAVWRQDAIYLAADQPMQPVTYDNPSLRAAAARLGITLPPRLGERY